MERVNLSSPWVTFYREIDALLGGDPDVKVVYDEERCAIKVYVENTDKADALEALLPSSRTFGSVTVTVTVIPGNALAADRPALFRRALKGNPAFAYEKTVDNASFTCSYIVFTNKVVQFFNDDLSDVNGNCSTLYQEIAKDVFGDEAGVFFCTAQGG